MGTLICLINSLCSGVVAISPACSLSSSQSRAGVTQTAGRLPARPTSAGYSLRPRGEGPEKGVSWAAEFLMSLKTEADVQLLTQSSRRCF